MSELYWALCWLSVEGSLFKVTTDTMQCKCCPSEQEKFLHFNIVIKFGKRIILNQCSVNIFCHWLLQDCRVVKSQPGCGFGHRWLLWGLESCLNGFPTCYSGLLLLLNWQFYKPVAAAALSECTHSVFPVMKMMMNAWFLISMHFSSWCRLNRLHHEEKHVCITFQGFC